MKSANISSKTPSTPSLPPSFEQQVLTRLEIIISRLDTLDERLEAVEVRLSDMDLDTGSGFSIDD